MASPSKWLGFLVATALFGYVSYDFGLSMMHRGVYRRDYAGTVIGVRPRIDGLLGLFSSRHDSTSTRHRYSRDYLLTVREDSGVETQVAITYDEFFSTLVPSYVVVTGGKTQRFRSRAEAVTAGAISDDPAPQ